MKALFNLNLWYHAFILKMDSSKFRNFNFSKNFYLGRILGHQDIRASQ